jgi:succinate dehydrogenase/fumarate reductase flavoprotein subunit
MHPDKVGCTPGRRAAAIHRPSCRPYTVVWIGRNRMPEHRADVIVIGAGGAGLRAAIAAREQGADVIVIEKGVAGEAGCTQNSASDWMAYGAAFGHADENDSPHEHWLDIMIKGALVAQPELAKKIAFEAPDRMLDLEKYGACFDKKDGKYVQILSDGAPI